MKEVKRIVSLFNELYDGHSWIDVSIIPLLQGISNEQAIIKVLPGWNSIWEIVNHMVSWRLNVLQRLQGEVPLTPAHNYFIPLQDTSTAAWLQTLHNLEHSQEIWIEFLENFDKKDFKNRYPVNNLTYYEHIQGIIQHDAYHLGQISMLAKAVTSPG